MSGLTKLIVQRAKKSGFLTDMPLFHGTNKDIKAFSLERGGEVSGSPVGKLGVSLATDPQTASEFANLAGDEGANVIKAYHRASKPATLDLDGSESNFEIAATVQDAWDAGYDAIKFNNYTTPGGQTGRSFVLVKNPNQIRSINAEFDPKKINSANILAGITGAVVGIGALTQTTEADAMESKVHDMEKLLELYREKGDKKGQLKILKAISDIHDSLSAEQ